MTETPMLTNWITPQALAALNEGFVVAIMLDAKEGEADAVAEILRVMTPPTMAEPGVKLFLPYRSPTNPSQFFVFELYVNEGAWKAHEATEHFKVAIEELKPRLSRRERVPLRSIHQEVVSSSRPWGLRLVSRRVNAAFATHISQSVQPWSLFTT
jgi:quinol monooxygenase YgiN